MSHYHSSYYQTEARIRQAEKVAQARRHRRAKEHQAKYSSSGVQTSQHGRSLLYRLRALLTDITEPLRDTVAAR